MFPKVYPIDHYCQERILKKGVQSQISLESWIPYISFWESHRAYQLIKGLQKGTLLNLWLLQHFPSLFDHRPFFGHRPFSKQRNFWGTQFGKHCNMRVSRAIAIPAMLGLVSLPGTIRCWACSSTSRAFTVRLSPVTSFRQHCCCSELVITCWFSPSIWNTVKDHDYYEGKHDFD